MKTSELDKFLEHVLEEDGDNDDDNIEFLSDTSLAPGDISIETSGGLDSNPKDVQAKNSKKRVNFTKASCTLDASVKIYSYRVDDVHLTSYKVLANLNLFWYQQREQEQWSWCRRYQLS